MKKATDPCQHCHQRAGSFPRKLCRACHKNLAIRHLYPSLRGQTGALEDFNGAGESPQPTLKLPGRLSKIEAMADRASRGEYLFSDRDMARDL